MGRHRGSGSARDYPRTARLNELLREILGDAVERLDDDRLELVSVSGVQVDNELSLARVYVSSMDDVAPALEALVEHRRELKRAIADQARLRRTPELTFTADPAIAAGDRVEAILRELSEAGEADQLSEAGELSKAGQPGGLGELDEADHLGQPGDRDGAAG